MKLFILESIILESLKNLKKAYNKQGISDAAINYYIERFKEINGRRDFQRLSKQYFPHINNVKDVTQYKNFKELEKIVDAFPKPVEKNNVTIDGADAIYNKDGLEIYQATDKKACIKYGSGYSWCISTKSGGNLFYQYRHQDQERMFYFVFDRNLQTSNPYHAVVIHVYKNGKYGFSNADNKGDVDDISWNKIISLKPELRGLKKYFKYIPLSNEEKKLYKRISEKVGRKVQNLMTYFEDYETVEHYIEYGHQLTGVQFSNLSDELQEIYFAKHSLTWGMYKSMTLKNKIKYLKTANIISEDIIKNVNTEKEKATLMNEMFKSIKSDTVIKMAGAIPILIHHGNDKQLEYYFEELYKKIPTEKQSYVIDKVNSPTFYHNIEPFLKKNKEKYEDVIMDKLIEYNKGNENKLFFKEEDLEYFNGKNILKYSKILEKLKKIPFDELKLIFSENPNYAIKLLLAVKDKILNKPESVKNRILNYYKEWIGEKLVNKIFN